MLSQEPIQADRFVPKHPKLPLSLSSSCAFSAGKRKDAKIRKINWLLKVCQLRRRPWFSTRDTGRVEDAQLGYLLYFAIFLTFFDMPSLFPTCTTLSAVWRSKLNLCQARKAGFPSPSQIQARSRWVDVAAYWKLQKHVNVANGQSPDVQSLPVIWFALTCSFISTPLSFISSLSSLGHPFVSQPVAVAAAMSHLRGLLMPFRDASGPSGWPERIDQAYTWPLGLRGKDIIGSVSLVKPWKALHTDLITRVLDMWHISNVSNYIDHRWSSGECKIVRYCCHWQRQDSSLKAQQDESEVTLESSKDHPSVFWIWMYMECDVWVCTDPEPRNIQERFVDRYWQSCTWDVSLS